MLGVLNAPLDSLSWSSCRMGYTGGPSDVGVPIEGADRANVLATLKSIAYAGQGTGFRGPLLTHNSHHDT